MCLMGILEFLVNNSGLIYCRLINPVDSFLLSSVSMGSLNKILKNLNRQDILKYGQKNEHIMHVGTWNVLENHPDMGTMIPAL